MGVQERREREKLARKEAILNAAQGIFFDKGLDRATVDEIAEATELSKGTIYLYFKSKEELYISVLLKGLDILAEQFEDLKSHFGAQRADELIKEARETYYAFYRTYPEFLYIHSLLYHGRIKEKIDPDILADTHDKTKQCLLVLSDIIQKGINDGLFRDVDTWKTANSFWGAATGVMMMMDDEDHQAFITIPVKELMDDTIEMLLDSLMITHSSPVFQRTRDISQRSQRTQRNAL